MAVDRGLEQLAADVVGWIRDQVVNAGLRGTAFGLSGGVDSAVVAALCRRAVGDCALGLILPCHSEAIDVADALDVAEAFDLATDTVDLGPAYDILVTSLESALRLGSVPAPVACLASANLKPRLRMMALYYYSNCHQLLVVGTSNRSELHVGYATKYGDSGVDVMPLANLLKRDVWALARHLGVPERVIERPPSAGLWPGQTDEGEMGLTYAELDGFLATGQASEAAQARIERLHYASEHKRRMPPKPE